MSARPSPTRRARAYGLAIGAAVLLSGCELPDVSMSPMQTPSSASASPTATAAAPSRAVVAATAAPTAQEPVRPPGDLDTGSITHQLAAGDRSLVIDYWTTQDPTTWAAADTKIIQLSAHIEGGDDDIPIDVTRFVATSDDGVTRSVALEDKGSFALAPPFSYSTALTLTPSAATASSLTLYVQFDLLVATTAKGTSSYRQTVLDTLTLPLVQETAS
ncbi:hypothetical protein GB931_04220 [Modestobacter sp. I12A-02628]|uniref:Uncharacterized protein n=1 Tax=Goekera deserti TaxID=2497753 RepID=A0A7K3WDT1_9ACTN|nr:hypothetical protein [Goekera deserti]MPQ97143.1 hypothetical protein [Goekera deserti]NDI46539.1 hypothetical protein [Goekera deserti]NEL54527.1 hypothetical protein [Goekera deserti]